MKINHTLHLDLANPGLPQRILVTQDDSGSQVLRLRLKENGCPWPIPADAAALIHFRKSDRTGGIYDTLPDGSAAWQAKGNELRVILAPQVLTAPGETALAVTLVHGSSRLTVATVVLQVTACPGFAGLSESYSYVSAFLPQPEGARAGQLLQVKAVNEKGIVLQTQAVSGGGGGIDSISGQLLLSLLQKAVYTEDVSDILTTLEQQFGGETPSVTLSAIEAVYTGGAVYAGSDVKLLQGITVTAHYSDGSRQQVKDFSLSGVIVQGENTVTVSYGGCYATVTVVGIARPVDQYAVYNNLSYAANSNTATVVAAGGSYSCVITAHSGYALKRVLITMNGVTVFEENYTTAPLESGWSTNQVTGDIIITAIAQAEVALSSLSAVYTGGSVPEGTSLSTLTGNITVTAHYSDGTQKQLTGGYGLDGAIAAGENVITVSYGGLTADFTVTGVPKEARYVLMHNWDFTQSLTDTVSGITATTNATQDASGIAFTEIDRYIRLITGSITNKAVEIDIPSGAFQNPAQEHARIFGVSTDGNKTNSGAACLVWRCNTAIGWASYYGIPFGSTGGGWDETISSTQYPMNFFHQKTLRLEFDGEGYFTAYAAPLGSQDFTKIHTWENPWTYLNGGFIIGSVDNNELSPITFSAVRIYEKEL